MCDHFITSFRAFHALPFSSNKYHPETLPLRSSRDVRGLIKRPKISQYQLGGIIKRNHYVSEVQSGGASCQTHAVTGTCCLP